MSTFKKIFDKINIELIPYFIDDTSSNVYPNYIDENGIIISEPEKIGKINATRPYQIPNLSNFKAIFYLSTNQGYDDLLTECIYIGIPIVVFKQSITDRELKIWYDDLLIDFESEK